MVRNNPKNPFLDFENYISEELQNDLNEFYRGPIGWNTKILNKDEESQEIQISIDGKIITQTFGEYINQKLHIFILEMKSMIENGILQYLGNKTDLTRYLSFLEAKIFLLRASTEISRNKSLQNVVQQAEDLIDYYSKSLTLNGPISGGNSMLFVVPNGEIVETTLTKLYLGLVDKLIIEGSMDDFIAAFTNKPMNEGIKWKVKSKNGLTSKVSLFYFFDKLIEKGFINKNIRPILTKVILQVFRDSRGTPFENLKQSKSTISKKTSKKEELDCIIDSLI